MYDIFIWLFLVHMSFTCVGLIYIYIGHCVSVSPFEDTLCMAMSYAVFIYYSLLCYVDLGTERSNN